ncbi:MAG TPA: FAA hydrolase family protein, partial [bacterium]|nr:FAA hydrolase family protein [bacterium]
MRFCMYQAKGEARVGVVAGDAIVDLQTLARRRRLQSVPQDMLELIAEVPTLELRALAREAESLAEAGKGTVPLARARLLAPIPRPRKNIMCMGRNYVEHAKESGSAPPEVPVFFTKP